MVSIITVNYNNSAVTCDLLKSLQHLNRSMFEVIVVDNCSNENPLPIKDAYPWIILVQNSKNLGFAGGNNVGAQNAKGEYFFFINNDTELKDDIISRLKMELDKDKMIGIICPVINYFEEYNLVQYAGYTCINPITGRNQLITSTRDRTSYQTAYAHGAAMMMRREVYQKVGPMPENYFLYYEELDWSASISKLGYKILVDPSCVIYHKESKTVSKLSEMKSYFLVRNRILFMRRNFTLVYLSFFWFFFLVVTTPNHLLKYSFNKEWKNIIAHFAAIWWNVTNTKDSKYLGYKFNSIGV